MAETLVSFEKPVFAGTDGPYYAKACGGPVDHMWEGWIEFTHAANGTAVRTGRETTQPNRQDLIYWATGLEKVYLEGALRRTALVIR